MPSKTCTAVLPANSTSIRDFSGRFISSTNGTCSCFSAASLPSVAGGGRRGPLPFLAMALLTYRSLRATESA